MTSVASSSVTPANEHVKKSTISWISAVRPSRQPLRGFLRMRIFLHGLTSIPHAEEHSKRASRSTHDADAVPLRDRIAREMKTAALR
jgi:hypothetical protein